MLFTYFFAALSFKYSLYHVVFNGLLISLIVIHYRLFFCFSMRQMRRGYKDRRAWVANFLSEKFIQTTCSKNKVIHIGCIFGCIFTPEPEVKEITSVQSQLDINLPNYDYQSRMKFDYKL